MVACLTAPLVGQRKTAPHYVSRTTRYPYSTTGFTGVVPPHFQGNDLQKIAAGMATSFAERGEFETTAQYNVRIEKASIARLAGGIPKDSPLAFVFPTDEELRTDWEAKYAIDTAYDQPATYQRLVRLLLTNARIFDAAGSPIGDPDDMIHPDWGASLPARVDELDSDACASGIVELDASAFTQLWNICDEHGLHVVADVHTHPFSARQSEIDRANPMIAVAGHVALILPRFARDRVRIWSVGVYEYLGDHCWWAHGGCGQRFLQLGESP